MTQVNKIGNGRKEKRTYRIPDKDKDEPYYNRTFPETHYHESFLIMITDSITA